MASVQTEEPATSKTFVQTANKLKEAYQTVEEEDDDMTEAAWDDAPGASLNPREVKRARREEIEYVHKMSVYNKVQVVEVYQTTRKGPMSVRWIDVDKGDVERPNYRSRLVAREINASKRGDSFALTPFLEALEVIVSLTVSGDKGEVLMINDIGRALPRAPATKTAYVQLPDEDRLDGESECVVVSTTPCTAHEARHKIGRMNIHHN